MQANSTSLGEALGVETRCARVDEDEEDAAKWTQWRSQALIAPLHHFAILAGVFMSTWLYRCTIMSGRVVSARQGADRHRLGEGQVRSAHEVDDQHVPVPVAAQRLHDAREDLIRGLRIGASATPTTWNLAPC
jgi:hypothetical protein